MAKYNSRHAMETDNMFELGRLVISLFSSCCRPADRWEFSFGPVSEQYLPVRKEVMATITITDSQQVNLKLGPKDARQKPAKVFGIPRWEVSNNLATIVPAPDGRSARLVAQDVGTGTVTCTFEGTETPGEDTVVLQANFEVIAGRAVSGDITNDPPEEQPAPTPNPAP